MNVERLYGCRWRCGWRDLYRPLLLAAVGEVRERLAVIDVVAAAVVYV